MRKKQSKKRTGVKASKLKIKPKRKTSRRKNPALGYINTSDNKKEALEIQGINSEPLLGGIILKFYLVGIKKSFDILLYDVGINELLIPDTTSRVSRYQLHSDFGYANKHKITDLRVENAVGGTIIVLDTDYVSPKSKHLNLRSMKKGILTPIREYGEQYLITLYTEGSKLLKQLLVKKDPILTSRQDSWQFGQGKVSKLSSGYIEDIKPFSGQDKDTIYWDEFERGSF